MIKKNIKKNKIKFLNSHKKCRSRFKLSLKTKNLFSNCCLK